MKKNRIYLFLVVLLIGFFLYFSVGRTDPVSVFLEQDALMFSYEEQKVLLKRFPYHRLAFFEENDIRPSHTKLYEDEERIVFLACIPTFYGNGAFYKDVYMTSVIYEKKQDRLFEEEIRLEYKEVQFTKRKVELTLLNGYQMSIAFHPDYSSQISSLSRCKEKDFFFYAIPVEVYFSKKKENSFLVMTYLMREDGYKRMAHAALEMKYSPQRGKIIAYAGLLKHQISIYTKDDYLRRYIHD